MRLWTLERMHLAQLDAMGGVDGALAVMREDLSEAAGYHQVTEYLERYGRPREAFANAELGCKAFPGDSRLQEDKPGAGRDSPKQVLSVVIVCFMVRVSLAHSPR